MEKVLSISHLKKYYGAGESESRALDDVSFDVYKGELLVIVGNSGCGKSTLLNIIGGMDSPTSGDVIFYKNNKEEHLTRYKDKELTNYRKTSIGFIFQFYNLLPDLTAIENVRLCLVGADKENRAEKTLELVGLKEKANSYPSQLSGGEQQRVSIARALVKDAAIILCDEPTGALDDKNGRKILVLLQKLVKEEGQTMIIVTHTQSIANMANRVIKMRNGKIESITTNENPLNAEDVEW